ncbi:MAG: hypothetical protein M1839_002071 [Geoglossum umbratile]|nr:MAG: hypothetical protein M1839_002071 [Geoglossum umbratile]
MRNWLQAKSEDDRRRQEEEKTRQETIRLEVRKMEHNILRDSIAGGVPPYMIPMIFAGISGGNLANMSIEWAQQYLAQMQQQQQQQIQALTQGHISPEVRREPRMIGQQAQYGTPPQPVTPQGAPPSASQPQGTTFLPPYRISPSGGPAAKQTAGQQQQQQQQQQHQPPPAPSYARPGQPTHSALPRLNTDEIHIQPPPQQLTSIPLPPSGPVQPMVPLQGTGPAPPAPSTQEQTTSSPIFFHHWVPPSSQGASGTIQPTTPSTKSTDSPFPPKRVSQFGDPDYTSSPKKRKGQGGQATAPSGSQSQYSSPQFPQSVSSTPGTRRRGHSRNRSDSSVRGHDSYGRPSSRHRRSEGGAGGQGETGGRGSQGGTATTGAEDNGSSGSHQQSPLQRETRTEEARD